MGSSACLNDCMYANAAVHGLEPGYKGCCGIGRVAKSAVPSTHMLPCRCYLLHRLICNECSMTVAGGSLVVKKCCSAS